MEYDYYLKQIYRSDGSTWFHIHDAEQAEKLGYHHRDMYMEGDDLIFILGFDSRPLLNAFIDDVCRHINHKAEDTAPKKEAR